MCVCVRERERESVCVCVCATVLSLQRAFFLLWFIFISLIYVACSTVSCLLELEPNARLKSVSMTKIEKGTILNLRLGEGRTLYLQTIFC